MNYAVGSYYEKGVYIVWVPDLKLRFEASSTVPEKVKAEAKAAVVAELQATINARKQVALPAATKEHIQEVLRSKGFKEVRVGKVRLPVHVYAKVKAYSAWIDSRMSESALADRSGVSKSGVRGMWDLSRSSELKNIASVCKACGYDLYVTITRTEKTI